MPGHTTSTVPLIYFSFFSRAVTSTKVLSTFNSPRKSQANDRSRKPLVNLSYLKSFCHLISLFPKSHYQRAGFVLVTVLMHVGQHRQVRSAITALQKSVVFPTSICSKSLVYSRKATLGAARGSLSPTPSPLKRWGYGWRSVRDKEHRVSGMTGSCSLTSEKAAEATDASAGPRSKGNCSGMLRMLPTVIWAALDSPQLLLKCRLCTETTEGAQSNEPKHPAFYTSLQSWKRAQGSGSSHWALRLFLITRVASCLTCGQE